MFELLSGEPFYQGGGAGEILYQAATGPTVDHLARIDKLPSPAPDFLRRVLAMDAAARYPSARVFAQDMTPSATMAKGQLAEMMRTLFAPCRAVADVRVRQSVGRRTSRSASSDMPGRAARKHPCKSMGCAIVGLARCLLMWSLVNGKTNNDSETGGANMFSINRICFTGAVISAAAAVFMASGCGVAGAGMKRAAGCASRRRSRPAAQMIVAGPARLLHVDVHGRQPLNLYRSSAARTAS